MNHDVLAHEWLYNLIPLIGILQRKYIPLYGILQVFFASFMCFFNPPHIFLHILCKFCYNVRNAEKPAPVAASFIDCIRMRRK